MAETNLSLGVRIDNHLAVVSSRDVARVFVRSHGDVLRDIRLASENIAKADAHVRRVSQWFIPSTYMNAQGIQPSYDLTYDGAIFLILGYTGPDATKFKLAYMDAFNAARERYLPSPHHILAPKRVQPRSPIAAPDALPLTRGISLLDNSPEWEGTLTFYEDTDRTGKTKLHLLVCKKLPYTEERGPFPRKIMDRDWPGVIEWFLKRDRIPKTLIEDILIAFAMRHERLEKPKWLTKNPDYSDVNYVVPRLSSSEPLKGIE